MASSRAAGETLHTTRFVLRLLDGGECHATLYRRLYTCPQVMAHIGPPLARESVDAAFGRACGHNARDVPGHRFWAIEARESGAAIGLAALRREGGQAELGTMLLPGWQNRGVSSETFAVLLAHAFDAMALDLVYVQRADDGQARIIDRLLGRFGFEHAAARATPSGECRWELPRRLWNQV